MCSQDKGNDKNRKIIAIDLFCGAGGLTKGLTLANIDVKFGIDFDDNFRRTYDDNNKLAYFRREDVRYTSGVDLERDIELSDNDLLIIAACAPCQPFSRHVKSHKYDRRKSLLLEVGRILGEFERKPDFLFLENVPQIYKVDGGKTLKEFKKMLDPCGYIYDDNIINARDYGVPQKRRRFVMLAIHNRHGIKEIRIPEGDYGRGKLEYKTVEWAISKYPPIRAGESANSYPNHESAGLEEINLKRIRSTAHDGGSRTAWPPELWLECHKKHSGHKDVYGRMRWKEPAPTLTCKCTSISNGRFGHPEQDRAISLREAATLQTFPDDYTFYGNFPSMAKQIGNAVPVHLAEVFGKYFVNLSIK